MYDNYVEDIENKFARVDEEIIVEIPINDDRTFYATFTPIPDVGRAIIMQDITHLKELDRMKSDFVATVSHDLQTPLTSIKEYAQMLDTVGELNDVYIFTYR